MPGPPSAVAAIRLAVRRALAEAEVADQRVIVACSGGADSLALAAGLAHEMSRGPGQAVALIVDHGLQEGSSDVAAQAQQQCHSLGIASATVLRADVAHTADGLEADARRARLAAFAHYAAEVDAAAVLVGHTQDDQAETVLLGLARGSGTNSLAGMPPARPLDHAALNGPQLLRPLLGTPRSTTVACCADLGLTPWQDPHNSQRRFARVRARQLLSNLDAELGPGLPAALARTATMARRDNQALDEWADTAYRELGEQPWSSAALLNLPEAVRLRCWQRAAHAAGCPPAALTSRHLGEIDRLLIDWKGQGPIDLPGGVHARRQRSALWLEPAEDMPPDQV